MRNAAPGAGPCPCRAPGRADVRGACCPAHDARQNGSCPPWWPAGHLPATGGGRLPVPRRGLRKAVRGRPGHASPGRCRIFPPAGGRCHGPAAASCADRRHAFQRGPYPREPVPRVRQHPRPGRAAGSGPAGHGGPCSPHGSGHHGAGHIVRAGGPVPRSRAGARQGPAPDAGWPWRRRFRLPRLPERGQAG